MVNLIRYKILSTFQVATIRFSDTAELVFDLDKYQTLEQVETAIFGMPFAGSYTNIAQAINIARTQVFVPDNGDRPDVSMTPYFCNS